MRALRALDWRRRLRFEPLHRFVPSAPGDPIRRDLRRALHVRDPRGRWWSGGEAALRIAGAVPLLAGLSLAGGLPGMSRPVEVGYRFVARNRRAISRILDAIVAPIRRR